MGSGGLALSVSELAFQTRDYRPVAPCPAALGLLFAVQGIESRAFPMLMELCPQPICVFLTLSTALGDGNKSDMLYGSEGTLGIILIPPALSGQVRTCPHLT